MYHQAFQALEDEGLERPFVPKEVEHNAICIFNFETLAQRSNFISYLKSEGVGSVFHMFLCILHQQVSVWKGYGSFGDIQSR